MAGRRTPRITISQAVLPLRVLFYRSTLLFFLAAAIALIIFSKSGNPAITKVRTQVADVLSPIVAVLSSPVTAAASLAEGVREAIFIYEENSLLRRENARLMRIQAVVAKLEAENTQLRQLLSFVPEGATSYTTARVVSGHSGHHVRMAMVNAGAEHNVTRGQVVVNEQGLIGRITEVGNHSSRIMMLTDINSRVPVITNKTRERAILTGTNTQFPLMAHLPLDSRVQPGETVVTSGDGKFFPVGVPVGTIHTVSEKGVTLEPFVEWGRLEYVNIVSYKPGQ